MYYNYYNSCITSLLYHILFTGVNTSIGPQGKCSHGGIYDASALVMPKGGINSESFNYSLSPKFFEHHKSAKAAVITSKLFLSYEG